MSLTYEKKRQLLHYFHFGKELMALLRQKSLTHLKHIFIIFHFLGANFSPSYNLGRDYSIGKLKGSRMKKKNFFLSFYSFILNF